MSEQVTVSQKPQQGMITLRGDLTAKPFIELTEEITGLPIPAPRKISIGTENAIAWMSPDELLIFTPHGDVARYVDRFETALKDIHHLVADMSDARAIFRIEGQYAREVLAKGAPVDLSRQAFGPGDFRRTRLAQVSAAFWMPQEDMFDLMVSRSLAGFAQDWLRHAAREGSIAAYF